MNLKKYPLYSMALVICLSSTMSLAFDALPEQAEGQELLHAPLDQVEQEQRISFCSKATQKLSACFKKLVRFTYDNKCFIELAVIIPAYNQLMNLQDLGTALEVNPCDSTSCQSNTLALTDIENIAACANLVVVNASMFACSADLVTKMISRCAGEHFPTETKVIKGISCMASAASLVGSCVATGALIVAYEHTDEIPHAITKVLDLSVGYGVAALVFDAMANLPAILFVCPARVEGR